MNMRSISLGGAQCNTYEAQINGYTEYKTPKRLYLSEYNMVFHSSYGSSHAFFGDRVCKELSYFAGQQSYVVLTWSTLMLRAFGGLLLIFECLLHGGSSH